MEAHVRIELPLGDRFLDLAMLHIVSVEEMVIDLGGAETLRAPELVLQGNDGEESTLRLGSGEMHIAARFVSPRRNSVTRSWIARYVKVIVT